MSSTSTCDKLTIDEWESNKSVAFDGSAFHCDSLDEAAQIFFSALQRNGKVRNLKLRNMSLGLESQEIFQSTISCNKHLKHMELSNVTTSSDSSVCLQGSLFVSSHMEDLTLSRCHINQKMASAIGEKIKCGHLKKLKLVNIDLGMESSSLIKGIIKGSLQHLELRDIRADRKILSRFIKDLGSNLHLEVLHLDHCGIDAYFANDLCALASNTRLRSLSLSMNNLDGDSIGILSRRGLLMNYSLNKLILSFNPIGDIGARHLTDLLVTNPTISFLSMVECDIWSPGCAEFSRGLANMRGLKRLTVDSEWENHVDELLESMQRNFSLLQLWTDHSAMLMKGDSRWKRIGLYLRLNNAKRRILAELAVPASVWPSLLAKTNLDADVLYHFLTRKPELVPSS